MIRHAEKDTDYLVTMIRHAGKDKDTDQYFCGLYVMLDNDSAAI